MKHIAFLFATIFILSGIASVARAQSSASASIGATIVTPATLAKTADMHFDYVGAGSHSAGTVTLAPTGGHKATGGVRIPKTSGSMALASFTVEGEPSATYSITLPSSPITILNGSSSMTVSSFTSATSGDQASGTRQLNIGATLYVAAAQAPGTYLSATPFDVTVNYN